MWDTGLAAGDVAGSGDGRRRSPGEDFEFAGVQRDEARREIVGMNREPQFIGLDTNNAAHMP